MSSGGLNAMFKLEQEQPMVEWIAETCSDILNGEGVQQSG